MTTKLQRSIDLLIRSPHTNFSLINSLSINQFNPELRFDPHKLEFLMDKMLESHNIESMRKMMLIQEEVFKHQVHELHRLYNIQKKLMQELENTIKQRNKKTAETDMTNNTMFSVWHQTSTQTGHNFQAFITRDDCKELSEMPAESTSIHLKEDQNKEIDEENDVEVELTLSIGNCARKKRSKNDSDKLNQVQEIGSSSMETNKGDEYGECVYQENTRPHWLMQDLSLNRT